MPRSRPEKRRRRILVRVLLVALVLVPVAELCLRVVRTDLDAYRVWRPGLAATLHPAPGLMPGVAGPARFAIGAEGFRAGPHPAGARMILALGGSATECLYLDQEETWTHLLEARLTGAGPDPVWVPNAGRSGRNLRDHVVQLTHLLPQHPELDTVLLLAGVNDLQLFLGLDAEWSMVDLERTEEFDRLLDRAFERTPLSRSRAAVWKRSALWQSLRDLELALFGWKRAESAITGSMYTKWRAHRAGASAWRDAPPDLSPLLEELERHLLAIAGMCARADVRLILVTQPAVWSADPDPAFEEYLWFGGVGDFQKKPGCEYYTVEALAAALATVNTRMLAVAEREGIEAIDLATAVGADPALYYDDVHFSEEGARRVAAVLGAWLLARPPFGGTESPVESRPGTGD